MPTPTYTALANVTLSTSDSSIIFSLIPNTYRDLVLVLNGSTTGNADINLIFNNDTAANYSFIYMGGSGSGSGISGTAANQGGVVLDAFFWRSTEISTCVINILDYSATDKSKTILSRNNVAGAGTDAFANRYASSSAINVIEVRTVSQAFAAGTTIALYGIVG
jgi:hypothetical protein